MGCFDVSNEGKPDGSFDGSDEGNTVGSQVETVLCFSDGSN